MRSTKLNQRWRFSGECHLKRNPPTTHRANDASPAELQKCSTVALALLAALGPTLLHQVGQPLPARGRQPPAFLPLAADL
jgi:hypothetical protein